jgi:hypothetical protein
MSVKVIHGGSWTVNVPFEVQKPLPDLQPTGFDGLSATYGVIANIAIDTTWIDAQWPLASAGPGGYGNFYRSVARLVRTECPYYEIAVEWKGILNPARAKTYRLTAGAQQTSAENITYGGITYAKVSSYEANNIIEASYVTLTRPATDQVGTVQTPPTTVLVRPSVWSSIANPTIHIPPGPTGTGNWLLMDRTIEELPGTTVCFVTDRYEYIFVHSL